jgi:hypothetical protein
MDNQKILYLLKGEISISILNEGECERKADMPLFMREHFEEISALSARNERR